MYPHVNADYTVVPGLTPVNNTLVTLTDGSIIDVDDDGQVRGILRGPLRDAGDVQKSSAWFLFWAALSTASMAVSAYHGYKRNDSLGWALGWAFLGGLFPVITPTIALAQGFAKPLRGRR